MSGESEDKTIVSRGFRGPQACKLTGITYRQLDYWARTAVLTPSIADANGSGSQRLYSYADLLLLKLIKSLLDNGVSMSLVRRALDTARDLIKREPHTLEYLVVNKTSVLVRDGSDIVDLVRSGQLHFGFFISLEELGNDLMNEISLLPGPSDSRQLGLFTSPSVAS